MVRRAVAILFCALMIATLASGPAFAQAAGTDPDRCRGIGCVLKGGGINIVIKPAIRKPKAKPRPKPKAKPRRKAKPRSVRAPKKQAQPVRRKAKNPTVRRKRRDVVTPLPIAPSWEGLDERSVIVLSETEQLPIAGTFLLRFDAAALTAQGIDLQTVTIAELAGVLQLQPFQIRSIQRRFLPGAVVNLSPEEATRLASSALVARLTADTVIKPAQSSRVPLSWGLDRLDQSTLPLDGQFKRRKRAGNLRVYLLDSGVDRRHSEFGDRVVFGASFVPVIPVGAETYCRLHGTEMASLIMGHSMGVAADIRLIDVTVLPCVPEEAGTASSLIEGLYWVAEREDALRPRKLSVVNLSLTGPKSVDVNEWVDALSEMGIAVVVAAGNQGEDACAYSPASAARAITVGALDHEDRTAEFSNTGTCVKLHAPGVRVTAASAANHETPVAANGTSAATAYVSGILASNLGEIEPGRGESLLTSNGVQLVRGETSVLLAQSSSIIVQHCRVSVSVGSLNVRSGPTTQVSVLGALPGGSAVEVLQTQNRWARIRTETGLAGWVAMQTDKEILLRKKGQETVCR